MAIKRVNKTDKLQMRALPFALGCPKCSDGGYRTVSYNNDRVIVQHLSPKCENANKMYTFKPFLIDVVEL